MVLPRPALIAILGGVLVLAVFAFSRVAGQAEEETAPATADQAAQSAPAPQQARSGVLNVRLAVEDAAGSDGLEGLEATFGGPFQSQGPTAAPHFDFDLELAAPGEDALRVGAVSVGDRGFVTNGDQAVEMPAEGWQTFTAARTRMAELGQQAISANAPEQPTIDFEDLLAGGRQAGVETVDGVETVHTAGDIDVRRAVDSLLGAATAAGAPDELTGAAEQIERIVGASVKRARADLYVGREDGIMRRFKLAVDVAVPRRHRSAVDGLRSASIVLTVDLTQVNQPQQIAAPQNVRDAGDAGVEELVIGSGIVGAAMLAVDPAPGADRVDPSKLDVSASGELVARPELASAEGVPAPVARGLSRGDVVVLLFTQSGAADDAATRASVRALRGLEDVTVVTDRIEDISDYRGVVSELGIEQAPAVVIVDREGKAEVVEGYVDAGSLAQQVEDAR